MAWLIIITAYLLGAIPTAYIAGRRLKNRDIRQMGDGNAGAANAFRELGPWVGITVGLIDAGKGALAILIAQAAHLPQAMVLVTGLAAVSGHNWPIFLGFRGGRGESTTIGILAAVYTQPMLIVAAPAFLTLVISRNVNLTSAVLFVPLSLIGWWLKEPGMLIGYSIAMPCLVALTHLLRLKLPRPSGASRA